MQNPVLTPSRLRVGIYALVVTVNSTHAPKPTVVVHDGRAHRHEALVLDLVQQGGLGIRLSLRYATLPAAPLDYLAPRQRGNYFFEIGNELANLETTT